MFGAPLSERPKILGLVEFLEINAAAQRYGMQSSPATLTGPPNQFVIFSEICGQLQCFSVPINGTSMTPVEANGYEILEWEIIAREFSSEPENPIFDTKNPTVIFQPENGIGIPRAARTRELDEIGLSRKVVL